MTFPFDDYFTEYKTLGGKKTKKQYMENMEIFFNETWDILFREMQYIMKQEKTLLKQLNK